MYSTVYTKPGHCLGEEKRRRQWVKRRWCGKSDERVSQFVELALSFSVFHNFGFFSTLLYWDIRFSGNLHHHFWMDAITVISPLLSNFKNCPYTESPGRSSSALLLLTCHAHLHAHLRTAFCSIQFNSAAAAALKLTSSHRFSFLRRDHRHQRVHFLLQLSVSSPLPSFV